MFILYLNRKAQGLRGPVEPALSGCVMVTVSWCLALTGENSGTTIPIPRLQQPSVPPPPDTHTRVRHAEAVPNSHLLDRWMDGWICGWIDGWVHGWIDGREGDGEE